MRIILLEDINTLGYKDEVVEVKPGYGRNFLIPQKKAILATPGNIKATEERKKQQANKYAKMIEDYKAIASKVEAGSVKLSAKTGETGKIFGNITSVQISDAIKEQMNLEVDRRKIRILDDVKTTGAYSAEVELHREVKATLKFEVAGV